MEHSITTCRWLANPIPRIVRISHRLHGVGLALAGLGLALAMSPGAAGADSSTPDDPIRATMATSHLPWRRGADHVVRHWLVLGPVPAGEATPEFTQQLAATTPVPGAEVVLPGGRALRWLPRDSWTDAVDLSDVTGGGAAGRAASVFAFSTIGDRAPRDVLLSVGADGPLAVWMDGRLLGEFPPAAAFAADQHQLPVTLSAQAASVLVRLEPASSGAARFTLRVVAPGTVLAPDPEIAPAVVDAAAAHLHVLTDIRHPSMAAPVHVTVIAPGGRIVAQASASRGDTITFEGTTWPDGPYELRCATKSAWGDDYTTYLSWFKGDALAAARRAIAGTAADSPAADGVSLTERVVADILRDRLAGTENAKELPAGLLARLHSPLMEFAELALEKRGEPARLRADGFYRLAYVDEVDGSPQFARAYLPPDYDPKRRWPVVVFLHGLNPPNPTYPGWWSVDLRHNAEAARHHVIVIEPHARGNTQYLGIGERDVLRCLDEAERHFSVDADRVYLTGESMGGSGTWLIGSRHPDRFAAIAPVFGGWDLRVAPPAGGNPQPVVPRSRREDFAMELRNSFSGAEQLNNLPVFIHHGDADAQVSVEGSRYIARQLERWGYNVRYRELPGLGHEDLDVRDEIIAWCLNYRRESAPRHVRIRSTALSGASAYWLHVRGFEEPERLILADATVTTPGVLQLDTDNVAEVELALPAALLAPDRRLRVIWNGRPVRDDILRGERTTLTWPGRASSPLAKRPGMEGPISSVIATPFAVVVGTSSADPAMRQRCREKAEAFRVLWSAWQHCAPRVLDDTAVTAQDEQQYSLVLIGGADANVVTRRWSEKVPLRVDAAGISLDGRRWDVRDAVAQMIYPSPANAERCVLVVAATSADGMYFWNPALWNGAFGYPTVWSDWTIQDGRRLAPGMGNPIDDAWVASGLFDAAWRRDDRWTIVGDPAIRERAALRHAPSGGFRVADATLERCAGIYELAPGLPVIVTRRDDRLEMRILGGSPIGLHAEGEFEYANDQTAMPVVFERDDRGGITAAVLYGETGGIRAPRVK